jgi:pimeloyl-ACP methyl ester carboxylesterase
MTGVVSHVGHTVESHTGHHLNLDEQIHHKVAVVDALRERYGQKARLILIGHSVGAYMCLQTLKARPSHGIERVYGLFPTIQHIRDTPNGDAQRFMFTSLARRLLPELVRPLSWLPSPMLERLVRSMQKSSPSDTKHITRLLHKDVVRSCLLLSADEMDKIRDEDREVLMDHKDKIVLYYGQEDGWVRREFYHNIKDNYPDVDVRLCEVGMPHAFVLGHGETMAKITSVWIKDVLSL